MSASSPTDPFPDDPRSPEDSLELCDWRRRVAELYAMVRSTEPLAGWQRWRSVRDELFRLHPQSPISPDGRAAFDKLPFFPYEPSLRFLPELRDPADRTVLTMDAGRDGAVHLHPFARTHGLAP